MSTASFDVVPIEPQIFADIAGLPGNRQWFLEDGEGDVSAPDLPGCVYAGVLGPGTKGVVAALPVNSVSAHVHIAFHPEHRERTVLGARALLDHLKAVMRGFALFSFTPADNKAAVAMARLMGMREAGRVTKAHRRHMEKHDMIIFQVQ